MTGTAGAVREDAMRCPFLKDSEARFCEAAPFRKMIFRTPVPDDREKCSSREYVRCAALAGRAGVAADAERCPFLREAPVQYCDAAPEPRFIPCTESLLSTCQSEGFRYCDLFLSREHPGRAESEGEEGAAPGCPGDEGDPDSSVEVDGIEVPRRLAFAPNHLWLDLREDGSFHLGADAFLARVLGRAERVTFVASLGVCRPLAVLRVRGQDLHLAFPNPLQIGGFNVCLRSEPHRLAHDPYGRGWLFGGRIPFDPAGESRGKALAGLLRGAEAIRWMRDESQRMTRYVQERCVPPGPAGEPLLNDGGAFLGPVPPRLDPSDLLDLFNRFFSLRPEGGRP
jgi:hypothetical protein